MKSINRNDFIEIGSVSRVHGTRGEIRLSLHKRKAVKEWAFLEIKGKPVPFYVESVSGTHEEPVVKLQGVETPEVAVHLVGLTLLAPGKDPSSTVKKELGQDLTGYLICDETAGDVGRVEEIMEMPGQLLFRLTDTSGNEILIPAVDAFIAGIDKRKKIIHVNLPEGMLNL